MVSDDLAILWTVEANKIWLIMSLSMATRVLLWALLNSCCLSVTGFG